MLRARRERRERKTWEQQSGATRRNLQSPSATWSLRLATVSSFSAVSPAAAAAVVSVVSVAAAADACCCGCSLSLALSLTHSHTHTLYFSLSLSLSRALSLARSLPRAHTHTLSRARVLSFLHTLPRLFILHPRIRTDASFMSNSTFIHRASPGFLGGGWARGHRKALEFESRAASN
jgi:hypothetical protein